MKRLISYTLSVLVLIWPLASSQGQGIIRPNALPLGDKESLMGNTGIGGIASTGATYYNPGALTMMDGDYFSLSGSAYLKTGFEADPIARIADTDLVYSGKGFQSIPTSVIIVRRMSAWRLALSVLIPQEFEYEGRVDWRLPLGTDEFDMKILQNFKEKLFLGGISAARTIDASWSAGASVFLQSYSFLSFIDFYGTVAGNTDLISQNTSRNRISASSLLLVAGIQKRSHRMTFGFRAALPGVPLSGHGDYYTLAYSNLAGPGAITSERIEFQNVKATFVSPLDVGVGMSATPGERLTFALDVAYQMGQDYNPFENAQMGEKVNTRGTFRINGGIEVKADSSFSLIAGGSYTPSAVERTKTRFGEDFWAASFGAKLALRFLAPSFGFFYSHGRGEGTLPAGNSKTVHTESSLGVFLGSSFRF